MEPMKPMAPMADPGPPWWPADLGAPATSGGQDGARYAFFPDKQRLAVERDGKVTIYDSGAHRITGASQSGGDGAPRFSGADGEVSLTDLREVG